MTPYNTDLTRALKWQHNNAPNLQSIISQKADWYSKYNQGFWDNWRQNVFDIRTANAFGLVVWCIILGLPLSIFDFAPITNAFAYGNQRGNYKDGGGNVEPIAFVDTPVFYGNNAVLDPSTYSLNETTDLITFTAAPAAGTKLSWTATVENADERQLIVKQPRQFATGDGSTMAFSLIPSDSENFNQLGFNFYGGGNQSVALLSEIRFACQLRYIALVSNGRQQWINQMLRYIFNGGAAWDFPNKKYFYLHDGTGSLQPLTSALLTMADWEGTVPLSPNARTNQVTSSQLINSGKWTLQNCTVANSTGPDGTANGFALITPNSAGVASYVTPLTDAFGLPLNNVWTYSCFLKAGSSAQSGLDVYDSTLTTVIAGVAISWSAGVPSVAAASGAGYVANSAKVTATPEAGVYRVSFSLNNGTNAEIHTVVKPDISNGVGTVSAAYPQFESGLTAGAYIPTTTADPVTQTDYTVDTSTGDVTMGFAPATGAQLFWSGTWNWSSASNQQFGTGDGHTTDFTLTQPPGAVRPITTPFYMEYRVGAAMNLSAQFINLMNNSDYGIMPQCAGIRYQVVQED
jgi:hypothetical protein